MRRPRRRQCAAKGPRSPVSARPRRTPAPPCSATAPAENRKIALPIRILRRKTDGPFLPLRRLLDITLAQSKRASFVGIRYAERPVHQGSGGSVDVGQERVDQAG